MKITLTSSEAAFDRMAARRIIDAIAGNPAAVIGLSTGRTTTNIHRTIGRLYREEPFDTSRVTFFGVDEVTHVPRSYAGACYTMLKNQIIDPLEIPDDRFLMLPTDAPDPDAACRAFQQSLEDRGGIDYLVLGLGTNGHVGFNQPGTPFDSDTHPARMDEALEARIRRETATPPSVDLGGLTLGIRPMLQARRILLVAKGAVKAPIVREMIEGPVTTDVPATFLRLHPHCEVLLDNEAAAFL